MVRIITDSTSDLPTQIVDELGIKVVPLYVSFGEETYRDGIDLTTMNFYQKLVKSKVLPKTSIPSPKDFVNVYDKLAEETDEILVITISSKLSGTYEAALKAKELRKSKVRIEILDSLTAIVGLGLVTIAAAKAAQTGTKLDDLIKITRNNFEKVDFRIGFDTLEYLKKGGRIGTAKAFLGSMLKLNPVLTIKNGTTEAVTQLRSRSKMIDYLCDFATSFPEVSEIAIEDANTPEEVASLRERLSFIYPQHRIYHMKVGPVIGTHVGPRVLGIGILAGK